MTVEERIKKISERWFLTEPLLFSVFCTHKLEKNDSLKIPLRTGKGRIEYSSIVLSNCNDKDLTEYLKIEMFRILLKHPYQRQPTFPNRKVLTCASNITINDSYPTYLKLPGINTWPLPPNLCFEEYYAKVFAILSNPPEENANAGETIIPPKNSTKNDSDEENSGDAQNKKNDNGEEVKDSESGETLSTKIGNNDGGEIEIEDGSIPGASSQKNSGSNKTPPENSGAQSALEQCSELWEENQEMESSVNELIEIAESSDTWGTIDGKMKGIIKASLKIDMDYRKMLSLFKTSIISNKRRLTRMRPNRRFGFLQMGSRYEMATNLLIAVDVSGSVTDKSLAHFFSVINRFFKYGIEKLDVIQFDYELKSKEPVELKKAKKQIEITGRGGTSFQSVADYYCAHPEYDGLIYFTDGYASKPVFNTKRVIDVLWVLTGKNEYEKHKTWIKGIKRNRATYIPLPE